jgi:light-harvesting protein B-800-850 alpha chain
MNQGKVWRVVNPTIGVPIFLGTVVITSLFVHYQLLTKTTWVPTYLQGGAKAAPNAAPNAANSSMVAPTGSTQTPAPTR